MAFYTEIEFNSDYLTLKSFKENTSGQSIVLNEIMIKPDQIDSNLKGRIKGFPKNLRIVLEPEDLVFKNIKTPFRNKKLLRQSLNFEPRKYFKINHDKMTFIYHVWKNDHNGSNLMLIGFSNSLIDKYLPFVKADLIPNIVIKDFICDDKRLIFHKKAMDHQSSSMRIYFNGYLTGWKVFHNDSTEEAENRIKDYVRTLGLMPENSDSRTTHHFSGKEFSLTMGLFERAIKKILMKRFYQFSAFIIGLLLAVFIGIRSVQLDGDRQNLSAIDHEIKKYQTEYQIPDLNSIQKKSDAGGDGLSRILIYIEQRFPENKKIARFEYNDGEVSLTIQKTSILEANQIKEAMEMEKKFTQFQIKEGAISNEQRIIFKYKK